MEIRFPLILDGATGTELQKRGYMGDVSAEQWVLEHPESILDIQKAMLHPAATFCIRRASAQTEESLKITAFSTKPANITDALPRCPRKLPTAKRGSQAIFRRPACS